MPKILNFVKINIIHYYSKLFTGVLSEVCGSLRLELASAADYVHCEEKQKRRAEAYLAVLQQPDPRPLPLGEEVAPARALGQN